MSSQTPDRGERAGPGPVRRPGPRHRPAALLPRADGLRQVHAGAADRPQPLPAGSAGAADHPARPLRGRPGSPAGSASGVDAVSIERRAPTSSPWWSTTVRAHGALDYLVCDEAQFYAPAADRPARPPRRRPRPRRLRLRARHRLPQPALPRRPPAVRARRRAHRHPGRGAVLVRAPGPAELPRGRRPGGPGGRPGGRRRRERRAPPPDDAVGYQVLCRRHWVSGDLGPGRAQDQLDLEL